MHKKRAAGEDGEKDGPYKTALIILHGSKHSVLGASARRPILVYKAATSGGELPRILLPRTPVNRASASLSVRLSTSSRGATIKRRVPVASSPSPPPQDPRSTLRDPSRPVA